MVSTLDYGGSWRNPTKKIVSYEIEEIGVSKASHDVRATGQAPG